MTKHKQEKLIREAAYKALRMPGSSKKEKTAAGSALSQRKPKNDYSNPRKVKAVI
jgi:hypothetical protein